MHAALALTMPLTLLPRTMAPHLQGGVLVTHRRTTLKAWVLLLEMMAAMQKMHALYVFHL
jgi:hypothetical protein